MNKLAVYDYLKNRQKYIDEGRALEGDLAQQAAREQAHTDKVIELDRGTGEIYEKLVSKELHHANGNRGIPGFDEPINLREVWPWDHEKLLPPGRKINYDFIRFK